MATRWCWSWSGKGVGDLRADERTSWLILNLQEQSCEDSLMAVF